MKNLILLLLSLSVFACNTSDRKIPSEKERLAQIKHEKDSLVLVFDSLMQVKVDVPPLIDSTFLSAECIETFHRLARETGGNMKVLYDSRKVTKTILDIITTYSTDQADLMILIDKTSSMIDDLDNIQKGLDQILTALKKYKGIRLAVGTYGDKNVDGKLWYDFQNFETNFQKTKKFINSIRVTNGGDFPESVYDGIYQAFQENFWRSGSKRMVILLGDAPSLDASLSSHSVEEILSIAKKDRINMNFYPIVLSPFSAEEMGFDDEPRMQKLNLIANVYPNPTHGPLSVELENRNGLHVEIINQSGAVIKSIETLNRMEKLELYDQPDGLYILRVYDALKNYDEQKIILSK